MKPTWCWIATALLASGLLINTAVCQTVNVALRKPVTAMYTCGLFGAENFNTLSDASDFHGGKERQQCVDTRQPGPDRPDWQARAPSYPAQNIVDGLDTTWWQSASRSKVLKYGVAFNGEKSEELEATISIDLLQEFLVERIIIQLGDALTPQRVCVEKSLDGDVFEPWVFAVSDRNWCASKFSTEIRSIPTKLDDTICITYAADYYPPGDTISLSFAQVPATLKEWSRIRHVKVKFYDMLYASPFNVLSHSYNHYAVSELTVMAECPCNGQQTGCIVSSATGMYECVCGGNTRGRYCELCQPLFNQYKFEFERPCTECNCFQHADSCFYEEAVEQAGESIDLSGQRAGGGVCIDCKHNTDGNNCERCVSMYYRPINVVQTSVEACVPCSCNPSGSTENPETNKLDCVMNNDVARTDGKIPGDCFCKDNVQGSKCDTCKPRFFNLQQSNPDGCNPCECYTPGTTAASELCTPDAGGQCPCKANVQGRTCNECKDGFYGLNGDDANGCVPCACDVGGSVNQICDKLTGQCLCRSNNIVGRTCSSVRDQFYFPGPHSISTEFEDGYGVITWERDDQFTGFSGNGYAVVSTGETIRVLVNIPMGTTLSGNFTAIIYYSGKTEAVLNITIGGQSEGYLAVTLPPCAQVWCTFTGLETDLLHLTPGPNLLAFDVISDGDILLDKFVAYPEEFFNPSAVVPALIPPGCDLLNNQRPSDVLPRALCDAATFSLTMYFWHAPLACKCDVVGSTSPNCDVNGGQCECRPGVVGRTCDRCSPDTYNFGPTGCADCSCDALSTSCDPITGQCECPDNTFGRQCQFCLPNHWDWHQTEGCKSCTCDPLGSASLQCNATTGTCRCKPGVEGDNCDICMDGFHSLGSQGCLPCGCNMDGSDNNVCNKTSGQCDCKSNTEGIKCSKCKQETYGLGTSEALGCLNCVCMGVTTECTAGVTRYSQTLLPLSSRSGAVAVPSLELTNADGTPNSQPVTVTTDLPTALTFVASKLQQRLYWKMPPTFTSNLLPLYGTDLIFTVNFVVVDGSAFSAHEVRLVSGVDNTVLVYSTGTVLEGQDTTLTVTITEIGWVLEAGRTPVTRAEFLKYLARAHTVLVPASFATGDFTARLSSVSFQMENAAGTVNEAAEKCVCGTEYTGGSCEKCTDGYKRLNVSTSEYLGECVACECNSHSDLCDPDNAVCVDCLHNTAGDSCELCQVGYYGDATQGTPNDCTLCPCFQPRVINATCHANATDGSVACDFCREGYVGDLCTECDNLYYGNPQVSGGTCSPCDCNGNADTCNSVTGVCDACGFNTTGNNCERCATNFYGNASMQACEECACVQSSSTSLLCDSESGQCPCVAGVGTRTCSECLLGFWGYDVQDFLGCRACGCVEAGSTSIQCDASTGVCSCKPNTSGNLCDTCDDGFFGLPTSPCTACGCDATGTVPGEQCDKITGQCVCQPGVGGRTCDQCLPFYVNFTSTGCDKCDSCQEALGTNINKLKGSASSVLATADIVKGVQDQDVRLQTLSVELSTSLVSLGLANTNASSATDIVSNITVTRDNLVETYDDLQDQATALVTVTNQLETNTENEYNRHRLLSERTTQLTQDCSVFERSLASNVQTMTQYSNSAAQYAAASADSSTSTLSFAPELAQAQSVLNKVRDTTVMDATTASIERQSQLLSTLNGTVSSQFDNLDQQTSTLSELDIVVNSIAASLATSDNDMEEAQEYKSQADELVAAVGTILASTDTANSEANTALNAARAAVRTTNTVLGGDARSIVSGEDFAPFPSGTSNYETAVSTLRSRLTSLPVLVDVVGPKIEQTESFLITMADTLNEVQSVHATIPNVASDAVLAIKNFEEVITDLENSVTMATDANDLLSTIRTNVSGDAFQERSQDYEEEKVMAEALRAEMSARDYQIQGLRTSIQASTSRLNTEAALWAQVDVAVDQMTAQANVLNTKVQESTLDTQLNSAVSKIGEARSVATTVYESVTNQDAVLTKSEEDTTKTQQRIEDAQQLQESITNRLAAFQARNTALQGSISRANTLTQNADTVSQQIEEKIRQLENKLATAEGLLSQMRQPLSFDGNLGLTFNNPEGVTEHLHDSVSLEMRKPSTTSDGVVFFVDDPNTAEQLQIGLSADKIFFQYVTNTEPVVLESPAEICDNCWVRVDATRYGEVGHLTVTSLTNGGSVSTSTSAATTDTSSTISLPSNIYVGTLVPEKETTKVTNRQFIGCLHNMEYQGEMLNLWTTAVATSPTATCCAHPPSLPSPDTIPGSSFSGLGYLVLPPPTSQSQALLLSQIRQIDLEFRTFSTSVTLLLVQSDDATDYFAIKLQDGSLVWETFNNGQLLRTQVQGDYSTGQWVQVIGIRGDTTMSLSVRFTATLDQPSVSEITYDQLDLSVFDNRNIILGSDSNPLVEGYAPTDNNFAGCMRNLKLTTVTNVVQAITLSENTVASVGVTHNGCLAKVIDGLRFNSDASYVQFSPVNELQQLRSLKVEFVTATTNAILLFVRAPGSTRFLYVAIFGGNILVVYRQDVVRSIISSGQFVSDGQLHTLELDMTTSRVSVSIDGMYFEEGSATLSNPYLTFSSASILSLGGVPADTVLPTECPVKESIVGGMSEIAFNGLDNLLGFPNTIANQDVSLAGISQPPDLVPDPPVSDIPEPLLTCPPATVPGTLSETQGFVLDGSQVLSWTELAPADQPVSYILGSFQLGISFATYKADGVLMYVANSLDSPTNYFIVYFVDSEIHVRMRSSLQEVITVSLGKKYNTGQNYQLEIIKINDYVAVTVATEEDYANSNKNPETASTLNIDLTRGLYVGGLGLNDLTTSPIPAELKQSGRTNFAGAIYSIRLSPEPDENTFITFPINVLDRSTIAPVPQASRYGLSLSGGASYLGLGTVSVAEAIEVEITLTTSSSSGLVFLFYQAAPVVSFLAVDVHENQLRLHLPGTFAGVTSPIMLVLDRQADICDGQPHTISVAINARAVTTIVDGAISSSQTIPISHANSVMSQAQFFVAGIPVVQFTGVPANLQTDSLTACVAAVTRTSGAVSEEYDPTQYTSTSAGFSYGCPY